MLSLAKSSSRVGETGVGSPRVGKGMKFSDKLGKFPEVIEPFDPGPVGRGAPKGYVREASGRAISPAIEKGEETLVIHQSRRTERTWERQGENQQVHGRKSERIGRDVVGKEKNRFSGRRRGNLFQKEVNMKWVGTMEGEICFGTRLNKN